MACDVQHRHGSRKRCAVADRELDLERAEPADVDVKGCNSGHQNNIGRQMRGEQAVFWRPADWQHPLMLAHGCCSHVNLQIAQQGSGGTRQDCSRPCYG